MLGNSFTFFHDMPKILSKLLGCEVAAHTRGGAYLAEQLNPETEMGARTLKALAEEKWDYVVLQEQSNAPALKRESFMKSARGLCSLIRQAGAKPMMYATWAYRDGTEKLRSTGLTYDELYAALRDAYHVAAEENGALVADVGDAFRDICGIVDVYMPDDYHPSPAGSVLAAHVICNAILEDACR